MAEEILVIDPLTESMKSAGTQLIENLDKEGFEVTAALWFLRPETGTWRLILATPVVDTEGPLKAYREIQEVLAKLDQETQDLFLSNISAVDSDDPLVGLFRKALRKKAGKGGVRFTRNAIDGIYIYDSYVYRV